MSIDNYFQKCIDIWNDQNVKRTPTLKREMRQIIVRFYNDITYYHEVPEDKVKYLKEQFKRIEEYLSR
jgi:hypothetical protein